MDRGAEPESCKLASATIDIIACFQQVVIPHTVHRAARLAKQSANM